MCCLEAKSFVTIVWLLAPNLHAPVQFIFQFIIFDMCKHAINVEEFFISSQHDNVIAIASKTNGSVPMLPWESHPQIIDKVFRSPSSRWCMRKFNCHSGWGLEWKEGVHTFHVNPQLKLMKSLRQINENSRKLNKTFVECEWNEEKVHRGAYKTHSGTAQQAKQTGNLHASSFGWKKTGNGFIIKLFQKLVTRNVQQSVCTHMNATMETWCDARIKIDLK